MDDGWFRPVIAAGSSTKLNGSEMRPSLPKCDFLGPPDPDDEAPQALPSDWSGDPFYYLPASYTLTAEESDLAQRYRSGDMSGGYLRSQIACFRAPRHSAQHHRRRDNLSVAQTQAEVAGLVLPRSFVALARRDEYVDRIRHNNIWLDIFPSLVDFPSSPEYKLLQVAYEGQGCCHWSLLLIPDGSHIVVYHSESLDIEGNYPSEEWQPKLATFEFFECAASFDEWLTVYFLDCIRGDEHYSAMLKRYPGM